jgi:hypothetical protein
MRRHLFRIHDPPDHGIRSSWPCDSVSCARGRRTRRACGCRPGCMGGRPRSRGHLRRLGGCGSLARRAASGRALSRQLGPSPSRTARPRALASPPPRRGREGTKGGVVRGSHALAVRHRPPGGGAFDRLPFRTLRREHLGRTVGSERARGRRRLARLSSASRELAEVGFPAARRRVCARPRLSRQCRRRRLGHDLRDTALGV